MKITTLIENTKLKSRKDLKKEYGISLFIDSNAGKILSDTGSSKTFTKNAKKLGIPLDEVEIVVISHGHFDHGKGLAHFLKINNKAKIYIKKTAIEKYYIKLFGIIKKYIGLDYDLIKKNSHRFIFLSDFQEIKKNVYIITKINKKYKQPSGNKNLFKKHNGKFILDDFDHELILVIREDDGLILFTGCSHNGILNMIESVQSVFPNKSIKAVFGGFHLMNPITKKMSENESDVKKTGRLLNENKNVKKIFTGHCTGKIAYDILKNIMGNKLEYFSTGTIFNI